MATSQYLPLSLHEKYPTRQFTYDTENKRLIAGKPPSDGAVFELTSGGPECEATVESLNLKYDFGPDLPNSLDDYTCVILTSGDGITASDVERLKRFLENGGGVVMSGDMPATLAAACPRVQENGISTTIFINAKDLRAIADWFGSEMMGPVPVSPSHSADLQAGFDRPLGVAGIKKGNEILETHGSKVLYMVPQCDKKCTQLCRWSYKDDLGADAHAVGAYYRKTGSGILYWQTASSNSDYRKLADLYKAAIKWVATRPDLAKPK